MTVTIIRPGTRLVTTAPGVQVESIGFSSAVAAWWNVTGNAANCVAAYAPKGAADLTASYVNLANPGTFNAAPGVAPTFNTADGWTFNGTTQYLTTGVTAVPVMSMLIRFSNNAGSNFAAGADNNIDATRFILAPQSSTNASFRRFGYAGTATNGSGAYAASGVMGLAGASTSATMYFNGSSDGTITSTWVGTGLPIFIGNRNTTIGPSAAYWVGKIQALAIYNATLTAGQVATLTTSMNAL